MIYTALFVAVVSGLFWGGYWMGWHNSQEQQRTFKLIDDLIKRAQERTDWRWRDK